MEFLQPVGLLVRSVVLGAAGYLREEYAPGIVTLFLIAALVGCSVAFQMQVRARVRAMRRLDVAVRQFKDDLEFSAGFATLEQAVGTFGNSPQQRKVASAWKEFAETLIVQEEGDRTLYHNSVRPSAFFNSEDLDFGAGFWRHMPSIFVSVGLFLTFLGLVSALDSMGSGEGVIGPEQLNILLTVASAKFIMSLTGLLCSIVFTVLLRIGVGEVEGTSHRLSDGIEERLSFLSLERLAADQLAAIKEQREFMRTLGYELVAELGRPLKEEIPKAIVGSIELAMKPLLDQVGKAGTDGVGAMVESLSSRFTDDVGQALGEASRRLAEAGDRISELSKRMDQSSSKVGDELNVALLRISEAITGIRDTLGEAARDTGGAFSAGAEKLLGVMNQTLEGIRENTSAGAAAMSAAASDLRQAGESFRQQLDDASKQGGEAARGSIEAAGQEIGRLASEVSSKASAEVLGPLGEIAAQMEAVVSQVAAASTDFRLVAEGVKAGADASVLAAGTFRTAAQDLTSASAPIRSSVGSMEASLQALADTTQSVASTINRAAEATARSAADALAAAQTVLGAEQRAIDNALSGIDVALARLKEQGERIDDIDGKLGRAFEIYTQQVSGAVDGMRQHVQDLQQTLQPSLDTLRSVVEQAEQFIPQSRRG